MRSECCFCAELAGDQTAFHDLYPELASRLLIKTSTFVAMPSLGQLSPGHMLLLPRRHLTSFGELNAEGRAEARGLYSEIRARLARHFPSVICFEHGSPRGASVGGCGIVHAHVHFLPLGMKTVPRPVSIGDGWRDVSTDWLEVAAAASSTGGGYLMWHGPTGSPCLERVNDVPSQYLRRHVAAAVDHDEWDWRAAGRQQHLVALLGSWGREVART
jgi:diadenosine tetraphosphate (Ap4A) HIT family hydrolase